MLPEQMTDPGREPYCSTHGAVGPRYYWDDTHRVWVCSQCSEDDARLYRAGL